jgi:hypothetical protein
MKKFKITGAVVAGSLAATTLFGVAPASAAAVVMPPNANGVDNSGFRIIACEESVHMVFPSPFDTNSDYEAQTLYGDYKWKLANNDALFGDGESFVSINEYYPYEIQADLEYLSPKAPGSLVEINLQPGYIDYSDWSEYYGDSITVSATVIDSDAFAGGNGTRSNPYLIQNADQLNLMRCHEDKYFKLTSNIDLSEREWLPIGSSNNGPNGMEYREGWAGGLDGNGKIISNLEVGSKFSSNQGLFGTLAFATIRDLRIKDSSSVGHQKVGLLAGAIKSSSLKNITIRNSQATGHEEVGLLAGRARLQGNFSQLDVAGEVVVSPLLTYSGDNDEAIFYFGRRIGGIMGYSNGENINWFDLKSNVRISNQPITSVEVQILDEATGVGFSSARAIGGVFGELYTGNNIVNVTAKSNLDFEQSIGMYLYEVGGFVGNARSSLVQSVKSEVTANFDGEINIYRFGGFIAYAHNTTARDISSKVAVDLEYGCLEYRDFCDPSSEIGGFLGKTNYSSHTDVTSQFALTAIAVNSEVELKRVGGFFGWDDQGMSQRLNSRANLNLLAATATNNSLGVVESSFENNTVEMIGGFVGDQDDYGVYRAISSNAKVVIENSRTAKVGGFIGVNDDDEDPQAIADSVILGSVDVPSSATMVGGLSGDSGYLNLNQVILSVSVDSNGGTEDVNPVIGNFSHEDTVAKSRVYNTFFNSDVMDLQESFPLTAVTAKKLKSAKFLKVTGFQIGEVFNLVSGRMPTVVIDSGVASIGTIAKKNGQSNANTSISFGKLLSGGARKYFVNLRNSDARRGANLVVVRNGKVVSTLVSKTTNAVGNYAASSTFVLKVGDMLQVRISGKTISKLLVK